MNNENDITRQYTDEQIWEMLKPKMEKMGYNINLDSVSCFNGKALEELIVTIYKSGYIRGQKGRSFIIGEKKKGHWEPCYKGEKLPEGTKVKLNKKVDFTNNSMWHFTKDSIGYSTKEKVNMFNNDTWILFEGEEYPFYFGIITDRLLKWVEE